MGVHGNPTTLGPAGNPIKHTTKISFEFRFRVTSKRDNFFLATIQMASSRESLMEEGLEEPKSTSTVKQSAVDQELKPTTVESSDILGS